MNARHVWFWPGLFVMFLIHPFPAEIGATQSSPNGSAVKTANGLTVITFTLDPGKIIVNLPDDVAAGDTISGTVVEEPKGSTPQEKEKNKSVLDGLVIDLEGTKAQVKQLRFVWLPPTPQPGPMPPRYQLKILEITKPGSSGSGHVYSDCFIETYNWPKLSASPSENIIEKVETKIPSLGQTGRPIVITGPFDGKSDNTIVKIGGQPVTPLAESPRKVVFESPNNVTGPVGISVDEGGKETKGTYRNVGVNLTAPKTSLQKGESTTLKIEVSGLQGIKEPVPLHLTKGGVVTMQGGDAQTMSIKPAEVQSNGTFTTTRTITGVQTGVWNATATVVVFDFCLQDDNNGNSIILNRETGDYIFCQGPSSLVGANPISLSTIDSPGGNLPDLRRDTADYVRRSGTITAAEFNFGGGHIHLQIDDYTHTGNATVQTSNPKRTFTITDRDTRNNTCACK